MVVMIAFDKDVVKFERRSIGSRSHY